MALANNDNNNNRLKMKTGNRRNKPDLSEAETAFLRALLLDPINKDTDTAKALNDEVLFSLPFYPEEPVREKSKRRNTQLLQLWHAFENGVRPRVLAKQGTLHRNKSEGTANLAEKQKSFKEEEDDDSICSIRSDEEVRVERGELEDDISSCSSWKEEEGGQEHYDSWEILKNEYAEDFGFDYKERWSPELDDEEDQGHFFRILGTSADDSDAHPHVLSPPLMDALMSFMPESLENQNFWLRFSLVRDGSSINTLKHYVRASANTILAIETTTGEVFGAFTTTPWRTQLGFFGKGDGSFLWRMRHNRHSPCHSLFEQAQLETEIDVYQYSGLNNLVQHCSHHRIGIGGGNILEVLAAEGAIYHGETPPTPAELEELEGVGGFGIAVDELLARGTTSPCATYRNPSLLHKLGKTESFAIANMEVWTLTPAWDVKSAEKLEMTKYFMDQSSHTESIHSVYSDVTGSYSPPPDALTASDLVQSKFYRRLGEDDENEAERNRWQYAQMMGLF